MGSVFRDVLERSRHHTKDKQGFVSSVVAYDSLPGHHHPFYIAHNSSPW